HHVTGVLQRFRLRLRASLLCLPGDMTTCSCRSFLTLTNGTQSPGNATFGPLHPYRPFAFCASLFQFSSLLSQRKARAIFAKQRQRRAVQPHHHCGTLAVESFDSVRLAETTIR